MTLQLHNPFDIYTTSETCTSAGGYWYDNSCHGAPEGLVLSAGRIWMDRNLGASQVATTRSDVAAYGDLYQWGRGADGHQLRTSATTTTLSSTDDPGHGDFILTDTIPKDWRVPQNDSLWQGVSGVNNPCPDGFRLPTETEWETERVSWCRNDSLGAFASPLKLVVAGQRIGYDDGTGVGGDAGDTILEGTSGGYWSTTVDSTEARSLYFYSINANINSYYRALGLSVRCIQD